MIDIILSLETDPLFTTLLAASHNLRDIQQLASLVEANLILGQKIQGLPSNEDTVNLESDRHCDQVTLAEFIELL